MALLPLSQGLYAVIDDADWPLVAGMKWYAHRERSGYYAIHNYGRPHNWRTVRLSRFLLGVLPDVMVDHANRDTLDYRRANLRVCDNRLNQGNAKLCATNTSGFKGVSPFRGGWRAIIAGVGDRRITIGTYATREEAARAYDLAAVDYFGEFALTNAAMGLLPLPRSETRYAAC